MCVILCVERQLSLRPDADDVVARGGRQGEEGKERRKSTHGRRKICARAVRRGGGGREDRAGGFDNEFSAVNCAAAQLVLLDAPAHASKAPRLSRTR